MEDSKVEERKNFMKRNIDSLTLNSFLLGSLEEERRICCESPQEENS